MAQSRGAMESVWATPRGATDPSEDRVAGGAPLKSLARAGALSCLDVMLSLPEIISL